MPALCALAVLALARSALAAPPLVVADPARPSAVSLDDASTTSLGGSDIVCVAFTNNGAHTATKVGLSLAYVAADGTVLGTDFIYPTGRFFPGKRSAFSGGRGGMQITNGNCHPTDTTRNGIHATFQYRMGRGAPPTDVVAILVSAREIVYDEGPAWRSDDVLKPGDHVVIPAASPFVAAVPNGPPIASVRAVPGAPVSVDDAVRLGMPPLRNALTCVAFTNHDARVAKRVNVALALLDRTGTVVDVKTSYNTGTFGPGVLIDSARSECTDIFGTADGDGFVYRGPGGDVPIGRIIASPALVEFADGTSWQAPAPLKPGDRIP